MKEFIKHNPAALDNVETMANAMIESMRFVDNTLDYPEAEKAGSEEHTSELQSHSFIS